MPARHNPEWYQTTHWRWLRTLILARDPVCKICNRLPSKIADHIKPHRGDWLLFCSLENLQGLCAGCHSEKTAKEDGGFGNEQKDPTAPVPTGEQGKQFSSSANGEDALDRALKEED